METSTIIITVAHLALFVYTRRKYVGKYKRAQQELTNVEMSNQQLQIENKLLIDHINTFEE
jgi:hypothetical protein